MLLVDYRQGSADLAPDLERLGLSVYRNSKGRLPTLEAADVAFAGRGPGGVGVGIGIELKRLPDLVNSLRTGRLSGEQLPKLTDKANEYDHVWVIVEGRWKTDKQGRVIVPYPRRRRFGPHTEEWKPLEGGMNASEMQKQLLTLELCGGLHIRMTNEKADTVRFIFDLYHWFNDKSMDRHQSHLRPHDATGFLQISDFRAAVMKFPHVGQRASLAVEKHFVNAKGKASLRRAACASVDEWAGVEIVGDKGKKRRIGSKVANDIVRFCNGDA